LSPDWPVAVIADHVRRWNRACERHGARITTTFTGNYTRLNSLCHPDPAVRAHWRAWLERLIDITADLGAAATGSQLGILTYADDRDPGRRAARFSDGATTAQRAEVERLAGALHDEKEAHEALALALREEERLREAGRQLTEQLRTPTEAYAASLERLNALLAAGAIEQETFNRAMAQADVDLAAAEDRLLRQSRELERSRLRAGSGA
jgi:sugar phosphate isomerase/epimerase